MFRIRHLDHIVLRVRDVETMVAFYRDVLGCALERVEAKAGLYQLRAGSALIDLVPVTGELGRAGGAAPGEEGRNLDHFCLSVEPFRGAELLSWLRARGASPGSVEMRYGAEGFGPSIYLRDPEGNVVELKGPPQSGPAD